MAEPQSDTPSGPDFSQGVAQADIPADGTLPGHVAGEPAFLSEQRGAYFAIGARCTHYGGPLAEGLIEEGRVHCPWHHACFDLATGEALAAPAFADLPRWRVEIVGDRLFAREKLETASPPRLKRASGPKKIVIIGGGAAGFAAAERLRWLGFDGDLVMASTEKTLPCDRPNLSKDYLAGSAPEEWLWIKDKFFFDAQKIDLRLGAEIRKIDIRKREVVFASRKKVSFDAALIATGAAPNRPPVPGFDRANAFVLRDVGDARAIIERAKRASRAVVIGAGFIGMEVAASLRALGLETHVVAPDAVPLARVLGPEIGAFIRKLHEDNGVVFHPGRSAKKFDGRRVTMDDGKKLDADFIVLGVGVRPRTALAEAAGLVVENGVVVDRFLQTNAKGVFAAGDVAQYPDARSGEAIRVEHWVAAQRQGQAAAANMLGERSPFTAPPFFWSAHYGQTIAYVGHAKTWDRIDIEGSLAAGDFTARYFLDGKMLAAASLGRDRDSLEIETEMSHDNARLAAI